MALILIVDDEPDVLELIETTLEMSGHEVVSATNGEDALSKLRKRSFELIILDIMMPKLSGYEVLEQIREMQSRADTPVIVVTAKHDPAGVKREVKGGAVDHLAKPFLPSELLAAVDRALEGDEVATEERRRVLSQDAEVYGSMQELYKDVRENPESEFRKHK